MILFVVLKAIKCKLTMKRKENVVATDTLIKDKWSNRLVVINATQARFQIPLPNLYEIINVGYAISFELNQPTNLIIFENEHPQVCHFMLMVNLVATSYFVVQEYMLLTFLPFSQMLDYGEKKMVKAPTI